MLMRVSAMVERSWPTSPAEWKVEPPVSSPRSSTSTSRQPAIARWYAMLQPATPPPMMTTRAGSMGGGSLPGGEAAVDDQLRTRHERGLVARQEQGHVGDLTRLRDPSEWDAGLELLADRVGEVRGLERRVDDARVDHIAADLVAGELDRQRLGQRDQSALRRRISVLRPREAGQRRDRAHVDDRAPAGALQMRDPVLGHPEDRLQIDRHDAIPPPVVG